MKFLKLHSKTTTIIYKNSICSLACGIVFLSTMASVIIPLLLVSFLSPYSGVSEVRTLFEQPKILFQHKYLALGDNLNDENMIACSNFQYFNAITENYQKCQWIKYSTQDYNYDGNIDMAKFQLSLDTNQQEENFIKKLYLVLLFKGYLKHKCSLEPPATIVQEIQIPNHILPNGEIIIKGYLKLVQNYQFFCPYYGRHSKSLFHTEFISENTSKAELFNIENIRDQIKLNPAYFSYKTNEIYYKKLPKNGLKITLYIDIVEVNARYYLNIWERLGQFWLYFASFFGISFYICNKIKDFLFSRHILTSWEIIPWKKLY